MTTQRKGQIGFEDLELWDGSSTNKTFERENSQNQLIDINRFGAAPNATDLYRIEHLIHRQKSPTGVFNDVRHYGAKGDGSTDDTSAIEAAQSAVGGGVVYFPAGTYIVTGLDITSSGQWFVGDYGASLKMKDGENDDVVTISATGVSILNMKIDGNGDAQSGASNGIFIGSGINTIEIGHCHITDCYSNCIKGTAAAQTGGVRIHDCQIDIAGTALINITTGFAALLISDCTIKDSDATGIIVNDSETTFIADNTMTSITGSGISIDAGSNITITGNLIEYDGGSYIGIDLTDSAYCTVSNNQILPDGSGGNDTVGIYSTGGEYNVISSNILVGDSSLAIGIDLDGCYGCSVVGNTMDGVATGDAVTGYGIRIQSDSDTGAPNTIEGNYINVSGAGAVGTLLSCDAAGYFLENQIVKGNIIDVSGASATHGIKLYCSNALATLSRNIIMGNVLKGNSASTQTGILFDDNGQGSTITDNIIIGNVIQGWVTGIEPDTDVNTTIALNNFYNNTKNIDDDEEDGLFDNMGFNSSGGILHGTW